MPNPPYRYLSSGAPVLDLTVIGAKLGAFDEQREKALSKSRKFQRSLIEAQKDLEQNKDNASEWIEVLQTSLSEVIDDDDKEKDPTGRVPRIAMLNHRVEELCRFAAFHHFLQTGTMIPPSACSFGSIKATDEEYLAGACMGVAQDLARYAMGRATVRDYGSVQQTRNLVNEILEYLLQFDFRNGFLRRKYDGTKYSLKSVETLLYELSVTGTPSEQSSSSDETEPGRKRPRLEDSSNDEKEPSDAPAVAVTAKEELEALRLRMEHRDKLRETLIKKCRDGQKAAKQAIYALHRKDFVKAARLIKNCENCIVEQLLPIVKEEPPLRNSCYSDVVEEYAEAKLFYVWLLGKETEENENDASTRQDTDTPAKGTLLLFEEFTTVPLEPGDYMGGICDLTGEIGRFAVQRGTARDYKGVHQCLEANVAVLNAIQSLEKTPARMQKKLETLKRSVSKIERMIYEMSLSKAAGMKVQSEVKEGPTIGDGD